MSKWTRRTCSQKSFDNGQSSRQPAQPTALSIEGGGRHVAAMRAVATVSVGIWSISRKEKQKCGIRQSAGAEMAADAVVRE